MDGATKLNALSPACFRTAWPEPERFFPVFSESESKSRDVQVDLFSAARAAESSPASPAPEKHPQSVESSLVWCKPDFHVNGSRLCSYDFRTGFETIHIPLSVLRNNKKTQNNSCNFT